MTDITLSALGAAPSGEASLAGLFAEDGFEAVLAGLLPGTAGDEQPTGGTRGGDPDGTVSQQPDELAQTLPVSLTELLLAAAGYQMPAPVETLDAPPMPTDPVLVEPDSQPEAPPTAPSEAVPEAAPSAPQASETTLPEGIDATIEGTTAPAPTSQASADEQEAGGEPAAPTDESDVPDVEADVPATESSPEGSGKSLGQSVREAAAGARGEAVREPGQVARAVHTALADRGPRGDQAQAEAAPAQAGRPVEVGPAEADTAQRIRATPAAPASAPAAAPAAVTSTAQTLPTASAMVERIAELAELPGPPPHRLMIDLEGLDARIAVTLRGDAVAVDVVGSPASGTAIAQWRAEVAAALAARGLLLDGQGAGESNRQPGQQPHESQTSDGRPGGRQPKRRHVTGWRL